MSVDFVCCTIRCTAWFVLYVFEAAVMKGWSPVSTQAAHSRLDDSGLFLEGIEEWSLL
jgi:hypothetical protein